MLSEKLGTKELLCRATNDVLREAGLCRLANNAYALSIDSPQHLFGVLFLTCNCLDLNLGREMLAQ